MRPGVCIALGSDPPTWRVIYTMSIRTRRQAAYTRSKNGVVDKADH
jgi:hypothetical protein